MPRTESTTGSACFGRDTMNPRPGHVSRIILRVSNTEQGCAGQPGKGCPFSTTCLLSLCDDQDVAMGNLHVTGEIAALSEAVVAMFTMVHRPFTTLETDVSEKIASVLVGAAALSTGESGVQHIEPYAVQ